MQFGVNHLGHWALTALLMPALLAAPAARVVSVTSTAHHMGRPVDPANPHLHGRYAPWRAYGQSKLANYHFAIVERPQNDDELVERTRFLSDLGIMPICYPASQHSRVRDVLEYLVSALDHANNRGDRVAPLRACRRRAAMSRLVPLNRLI